MPNSRTELRSVVTALAFAWAFVATPSFAQETAVDAAFGMASRLDGAGGGISSSELMSVLEAAASEGDRLVVAVNSDASVRRLNKGEDRPIHPQRERARMVAALRCVDAVVLFDQDTPIEVVRTLRPDVLVKGGDYHPDVRDPQDPAYMVGSEEVKSWGGRAVSVPLVPGHSTTQILDKIRGFKPQD